MTMNKRISELILEIEFGMNMIEANHDGKENRNITSKDTIEQRLNDNLQQLERAFFEKNANELYG